MTAVARRASGCARALAGVATAAMAGTALAQASRDLANRPPSVYDRDNLAPTQVELYGLLSIGLQQPDDPARPGSRGLGGTERSRIGLRATEVLGRGWLAHVQLEGSLRMADGARAIGTPPDGESSAVARATVGLSDRDLGRIDLGRMEQAAAALVLRADPWGGAGTVGPGSRLHAPGTQAGIRSWGLLSYSSPLQHPVRAVLQASHPDPATGETTGYGASLAWDRLPWLLGVGLLHRSDGVRHVPLVAALDDGQRRITVAWTEGRGLSGAPPQLLAYRNLFIGLSLRTMAMGDPERNEWRAGLNLHRVDGDSGSGSGSDTKLGLGWRHRLSRHVWTNLGAAWIHPQQGASRWGLEATLTYSFQRDLRQPQGPR